MTEWRPLSRRDLEPDEDYDGPYEGVPAWMASSLIGWVERFLSRPSQRYLDTQESNVEAIKRVERKVRVTLGPFDSIDRGWTNVVKNLRRDGNAFLDVVDLLVHDEGTPLHAGALQAVLDECHSVWRVGKGPDRKPCLERRVDEVVREAVTKAAPAGTRPAQHLAAAWSAVYGRHANASEGYREAVRAVEAAAKPVISPRNPKATLGTMIADVLAKPEKWQIVLQPSKGDSVARLAGMMELLWTSQLDRHGTDDETVPLTVSAAEAEAAVHLAATLVHWFTSGAITAAPVSARPAPKRDRSTT